MSNTASYYNNDSDENVSRNDVLSFYSKAAITAQKKLCCPKQYDLTDLSHIPEEVMEISYGCGSPVEQAGLREGEVMLDLGSGGGIDCFIAAKHVGRTGRVYGIDMTEEMLSVARKNAALVTKNLGFNNIEFKQGFLEAIPIDTVSVDLVTSNCVINLSTKKNDVFKEIYRILKPGGRFLIADIISERKVPEKMKNNKELWGECVSGALTINEFLDHAKNNNFKGLRIQKDYLWKEIEGIKFYSFIIEGFKCMPDKDIADCKPVFVTYVGPFESVTFQKTVFPMSAPVKIDKNAAELLSLHSYAGQFIITDPEMKQNEKTNSESSCCD